MFGHIFKYRLLCNIRNKTNLFWVLVFPLVLATLFHFSLNNILSEETFQKIPIAVVDNEFFRNDVFLTDALNEVSAGNDSLFETQYVDKALANQLLRENKIIGYIEMKNKPELVVSKTGIEQSIVKEFMDQVSVVRETSAAIMAKNPQAIENGLFQQLSNTQTYVKEAVLHNNPNPIIIFFYTIFSMTCFFASFMGIDEVKMIQANQSYQAARISVSPTHKAITIIAGMTSAMCIQVVTLGLLFGYMKFGLKISFGDDLGFIAVACILGSLCGLLFGSTLATLLPAKVKTTETISAAVTMFLCFLSGMMSVDVKFHIERAAPWIRYVNPVNLITDSLYALYYFESVNRYLINVTLLGIWSLVFAGLSYFILRRQRYASI